HVDILFTDVVMPGGMTGVDLARAARQRRPKLGVLFTSGYAELADIRKAMMTENAVWLAKPYTNSDLAAKLREIVDH
ncbi:MAG TPA: response regulator, partial [Steroidobacteraceae bacterium]|nr:response regulator [Steroidobacteraceae bacterium]